MSDEPKVGDDGLAGRTQRMVVGARRYVQSDEAKARLSVAKEKAVEVGGAASAGAKGLISKAGQAAAQAKEKADEFSKSETVQKFRSGAKGLWDRIKVYEIRGVPWPESPIGIGLSLAFVFPLGMWLVWKHPAWPRTRKVGWTGAWAVLMMIGIISAEGERQKKNTQAGGDASVDSPAPDGVSRGGGTVLSVVAPQPHVPLWKKGDRGYLAGPPLRNAVVEGVFTHLALESGWDAMIEAEDVGDLERLAALVYRERKCFTSPWGSQVEVLAADGARLLVKTKGGEEGLIRPSFVTKEPPDIDEAPRLTTRGPAGSPAARHPSDRSSGKPSDPEIEKMRLSLSEGDRLWAAGDAEGAAETYFRVRNLWSDGRPRFTDDQKRVLGPHLQKFYAGMIEDCIRSYKKNPKRYWGSLKTAEELLDNAARNGVQMPAWLADLVKETKGAPIEEKTYKVSKGAFRGSITIEIAEGYDIGLDLKDFSLDSAGVLEFRAVWHPERNGAPMRSWAAYDSEGVKISDGKLSFGDRIKGGEPTKGRMIIGYDKWKATTKIKIE